MLRNQHSSMYSISSSSRSFASTINVLSLLFGIYSPLPQAPSFIILFDTCGHICLINLCRVNHGIIQFHAWIFFYHNIVLNLKGKFFLWFYIFFSFRPRFQFSVQKHSSICWLNQVVTESRINTSFVEGEKKTTIGSLITTWLTYSFENWIIFIAQRRIYRFVVYFSVLCFFLFSLFICMFYFVFFFFFSFFLKKIHLFTGRSVDIWPMQIPWKMNAIPCEKL